MRKCLAGQRVSVLFSIPLKLRDWSGLKDDDPAQPYSLLTPPEREVAAPAPAPVPVSPIK